MKNAKRIVAKAIPFKISVVSYMELVQGMRNKKELALLKKYFKLWGVEIVQISREISAMAMDFVEEYFLSNFKQNEFLMRKKSVKQFAEAASASKPKKLSKAGEWRLRNPNGLGVTINDMRAVMR